MLAVAPAADGPHRGAGGDAGDGARRLGGQHILLVVDIPGIFAWYFLLHRVSSSAICTAIFHLAYYV